MKTVADFSGKTFDYVVIGGGTSGLTVAGRLVEDPNVTVAVLEAGSEHLNDPLIDVPAQFGRQLGNPEYDWGFETVPQKHSNNQVYSWSRGKGLGGSSAVNFYAWDKPPAPDIDAWEALGNPGWNWERYSNYIKKTENFTPPLDANQQIYKQTFNPDAHGHDGPLKTSFPAVIMAGEVPFQETLMNAGIKVAKDPLNGDPIGTWMSVATINAATHTRTTSATAFYIPNKDKPNFFILCNALALRLGIRQHGAGAEATAVEFEYDGSSHVVHVKKDVILSAGALKSPQLLELSGIGDRRILERMGIKSIVDLPGVGANLQEHMFCGVSFELDPKHGFETLDALANKEYAKAQLALHAEGKGIHRLGLSGFTFAPLASVTKTPEEARSLVSGLRSRIEERSRAGDLDKGIQEQFKLQLEVLDSGKGGDCEIICFPQFFAYGGAAPEAGKAYVTIMAAMNHPFSRGTIHIKSSDPHEYPAIDPRYFEQEFDLEVFKETVKFIRRLPTIEPFKSMIVKEVNPGSGCADDEDMKNFIKNTMGTTFHTAGTASMLPQEYNGVVDPELRVYGTRNVRVADLSIVPLHIAAHTQATAYAIGEQAAAILKGEI